MLWEGEAPVSGGFLRARSGGGGSCEEGAELCAGFPGSVHPRVLFCFWLDQRSRWRLYRLACHVPTVILVSEENSVK